MTACDSSFSPTASFWGSFLVMTQNAADAELPQGDSALTALPGLWGSGVTLFAFVLPLGLRVSHWVWTALNEVHLEELSFWDWVFLLWGDPGASLPCQSPGDSSAPAWAGVGPAEPHLVLAQIVVGRGHRGHQWGPGAAMSPCWSHSRARGCSICVTFLFFSRSNHWVGCAIFSVLELFCISLSLF